MIFCIFYTFNLTGSGLLNRTDAEIDYKLNKKCKKIVFYYCKNKKYRKCPALARGDLRIWEKTVLRMPY